MGKTSFFSPGGGRKSSPPDAFTLCYFSEQTGHVGIPLLSVSHRAETDHGLLATHLGR
jgi:hypothetical protein